MACSIPKKNSLLQSVDSIQFASCLKYSDNRSWSTGFCSRTQLFSIIHKWSKWTHQEFEGLSPCRWCRYLAFNELLELIEKEIKQDLKNISQRLRANKLFLNVKKTELIIFQTKNPKLDYGVKFNLNGGKTNSC